MKSKGSASRMEMPKHGMNGFNGMFHFDLAWLIELFSCLLSQSSIKRLCDLHFV